MVIGWGLVSKIKGVTEEEAHLSWQKKEALENEFSLILLVALLLVKGQESFFLSSFEGKLSYSDICKDQLTRPFCQ